MQRNRYIVALVLLIFFVIGLITNILGPIIPDIIDNFRVSLTAAAVLPFAFFIAYGVMSIPAGFAVERYREKKILLGAFLMSLAGALSFALAPVYSMAIGSLFLIGAGMAVLQVAINPLLRVAGGEEHFAFNSAVVQFVFGLASFLSPRIYSSLVRDLHVMPADPGLALRTLARLTPHELPWVSLYWVFAVVSAAMIVIVGASRFPLVHRKADEQAGTLSMYRTLLRNPVVPLYFLSVFAYVGSEQGTADWMSKFLSDYHRYNPQTTGAEAVSWFWGLMTVGCFIGMLLLKIFDSSRVLVFASIGAIATLTVALIAPRDVAVVAFPLVGLFASVMWPILISLALNSVAEHQGSFAGILCTAIMGGAVVPLIIGRVGDWAGLRTGLLVLYITFGFVMSTGFWARPLIRNATIGNREGAVNEKR
ncbi:MAG TPA: MFS transporter [Bryobacteraceae bacterium]|nr:MFS transporter [Bryobacteraceae bacterium]